MAVTCDGCGALADGEVPPLDWTLSVELGRTCRYCQRCTRENLRAMEGRLDSDQW